MKIGWTAKKIALCAIMTATLFVGKQALSMFANIEVVTILTACYAYIFGPIVLLSVLGFVLLEMAIWGVAPWNIYYLIFWGLVAVIYCFLGRKKFNNLFVIVLITIILTAFFGMLSSFFDVCFAGFTDFFYRFGIYYARGIYFYLIHIISNAIIFLLLFVPLTKLLEKLKNRFYWINFYCILTGYVLTCIMKV